MIRLVFSNAESFPKNICLEVSKEAVPNIMQWYGAFHAGDRYTVTLDGRNVSMDMNGEML
jgi:hypothetical protein